MPHGLCLRKEVWLIVHVSVYSSFPLRHHWYIQPHHGTFAEDIGCIELAAVQSLE